MWNKAVTLATLAALLLVVSCASSTSSGASKGTGSKVLEGVVVDREHEAPGSAGASFQGTGNYYLVIEARDGDATSRLRYQVTYPQWFRFPEGSRVRITIRNNFLEDIRSNDNE